MIFNVTEGWTGPLPFILKSDGAAQDLTGLTVELILRRKDGTLVDTSGNVVPDADQTTNPGRVTYNPDAADLQNTQSPYTARWRVTDGVQKRVYYPMGQPDEWRVWVE